MRNKQNKCRIMALLLAVVLLLCTIVPASAEAEPVVFTFGQITAKTGERVTVPVTIENNPGIASIQFRVAYDPTGLTYVSANKGEALSSGTLNTMNHLDRENLAITWFNVRNATGNGVAFDLVFDVAETASGKYPLVISYKTEDFFNDTFQQLEITVVDGCIQVGSKISGQITSFGAADGEITVKLMQDGAEIAQMVTTDGTYEFLSVAPGSYSLVFVKDGHATKTVPVTLESEDLTCDVKMNIYGDVNSDGKVDTLDRMILSRHLANWSGYEADTLDMAAADVNADGKVDTLDRMILSRHLANWAGYETLPLKN